MQRSRHLRTQDIVLMMIKTKELVYCQRCLTRQATRRKILNIWISTVKISMIFKDQKVTRTFITPSYQHFHQQGELVGELHNTEVRSLKFSPATSKTFSFSFFFHPLLEDFENKDNNKSKSRYRSKDKDNMLHPLFKAISLNTKL